MTIKEALLAQINFPLKDASVNLALVNAGVTPDVEYAPADHKQAVETALAGLILIVATSPKSMSDMDASISTQDIEDLLLLRTIILKRYNLTDELAYTGATIQDATHFWGTTNYD